MKLAAVDVGSNAARLQICRVITKRSGIDFKLLESIRFPLRLGEDVFKDRFISPQKEQNIMKFFGACKLLMELHEVDDYMMCATSAMRDAKNGTEIVEKIKQEFGLNLSIITGNQESEYVNKAILRNMDDKNYLNIDVGGGSTEISLFCERELIISKSFEIGSVRLLQNAVDKSVWKEMQEWVEKHIEGVLPKLTGIGIGGNINKIAAMVKGKEKKFITIKDIEDVQKQLEGTSLEYRINELALNPDRADVILPASNVYLSIMKWAKVKEMITPGVGLKEGIIEMLIEKHQVEVSGLRGLAYSE